MEILELCEGVEGLLREATCPEETEVTEEVHVALHTQFNTFDIQQHCMVIPLHFLSRFIYNAMNAIVSWLGSFILDS